MSSTTTARDFTVIQVAASIPAGPMTASAPAKQPHTSLSPAAASKPVLLMLTFLVYAVYSLLTENMSSSRSEPLLCLLCLPYAVVMTQKLLKTVRSMESEEAPIEASGFSQDIEADQEDECEFGSDASHDAIAVVGDVCVYVVVILLLCYVMLPWQVRAGQVSL